MSPEFCVDVLASKSFSGSTDFSHTSQSMLIGPKDVYAPWCKNKGKNTFMLGLPDSLYAWTMRIAGDASMGEAKSSETVLIAGHMSLLQKLEPSRMVVWSVCFSSHCKLMQHAYCCSTIEGLALQLVLPPTHLSWFTIWSARHMLSCEPSINACGSSRHEKLNGRDTDASINSSISFLPAISLSVSTCGRCRNSVVVMRVLGRYSTHSGRYISATWTVTKNDDDIAGAASVMAPAVANPAYMGYKVLYRTVLDKVGGIACPHDRQCHDKLCNTIGNCP